MKNFLKEFLRDFSNLFFPPICLGCKTPLIPNELTICVQCKLQLPFTYFHLYENNLMMQKLTPRLKLELATALCYFESNSVVERLIYHLKYGKQEQLGSYFGKIAGELIHKNIFIDIDAVIPVPLHSKRKRKRGYNQVTLFGKEIANYLEVPLIENELIRIENTKQLAKTSPLDRALVLKNAFQYKTKNDKPKHFLLVDDVITTGATLVACGKLLTSNSKNRLSIATIGYRN